MKPKKIDKEIVLKAVDALNVVHGKFTSMNGTGKENQQLAKLLENIGDHLYAAQNPKEVIQKKEVHCSCCGQKKNGDHNSESNSDFTNLHDRENYAKQISDVAKEFNNVIKTFACFQKKYPRLNGLVQNIQNSLQNSAEGVESPSSKEQLHCSCCSQKRKLISDGSSLENSCKRFKADANTGINQTLGGVPTEDVSPEEQVFAIDLVLEQILRSTSIPALIACRAVSSRWNFMASKILTEKEAARTNITFWDNDDSTNNDELEALIKIMDDLQNQTPVKKFWSTDFRFSGGPLDHKLFQEFLTRFGSEIKSFSIDFGIEKDNMPSSITDEDLARFKKLLTVQLPNVEKLGIYNHPNLSLFDHDLHVSTQPVGPEPNQNLRLKSFDIGAGIPRGIFESVLQVAVNLEEVYWDSGAGKGKDYLTDNSKVLLPSLIKFNKIHLTKKIGLHFSRDNYSNAEPYQAVADKVSPLEKIVINFDSHTDMVPESLFPTFSAEISNMLAHSAESLTDLSICPLGFLPQVQIPVLSKLECFTIRRTETPTPTHGTYFPRGLIFSETFPNLKRMRVKIDFRLNENYNWEQIFNVSDLDVHPTVEELYFSECPPLTWLKNFARMFPNLTTLTIRNQVRNVTAVIETLYIFTQLKNLVLGYRVNFEAVKFPALDAAWTGFSHETVYDLFEDNCHSLDEETLKEFRVHKSILDIKNLQHLKLLLINDWRDESDRNGTYETLVSHVSGTFAFRMCPHLQIELVMKASKQDDMSFGIGKLWTGVCPLFPFVHSAEFIV